MITTVVNLKTDDFDVYIGRGSKWGNPFSHLDRLFPNPDLTWVASRAEAIERYREWIEGQPELLDDLHELHGKRLGCFCSPRPCHGEVLAELADEI
jgi:hypothetical protein